MDVVAQVSALVYDRWRKRNSTATRICLLLGAGADISSGGLTFEAFKRECSEEILGLPVFQVTDRESIEQRFQEVFSRYVDPNERALLVEKIFRKMISLSPSDSYKLLILLMEEGAIDAVITTNFDIMLESAQKELQRDVIQVYAPGVAKPFPVVDRPVAYSKRPYLKLHGDLASQSVSHLTKEELQDPHYDTSLLLLLSEILRTHDLIIAGYSGFDPGLARFVGETLRGCTTRIYWFDKHAIPEESFLRRALPSSRLNLSCIEFDSLIARIAKPVLEKPKAAQFSPIYIRSLFSWRVDYCNREYLEEYGSKLGLLGHDFFVKRRAIEGKILRFLQSDRSLTVLAGASGYGKTTIGLRLFSSWQGDETRKVLLIKSKSLVEPDIEAYLAQQLGGLGPRTPFSLYLLERWLKEEGVRLVLFIDAINEYSSDLHDCIKLFRSIMRIAYFLPETSSALRIIATIRQETWNAMISRLDPIQLQQSLWSESDIGNTVNAITITPFSNEEVQEALKRLRGLKGSSLETEKLLPSDIERLKDPYIFTAIASSAGDSSWGNGTANVYQRVFESKLKNNGANLDPAALRECLAGLALRCLETQRDTFRPLDVHRDVIDNSIVRILKDLGVLVDADFGLLRFSHDRTQEYFLAVGLALPDAPNLESTSDLEEFVHAFRHNTKAMAAARMYFALLPRKRFATIESAIGLVGEGDGLYHSPRRELLFGFAKEVLLGLTEDNPTFAANYIADVIQATKSKGTSQKHLRIAVQAASYLPVEIAVPLLSKVEYTGYELAATEANIYATDKLAQLWLRNGCPYIDLLSDAPYSLFFDTPTLPLWRQLGRLIGLISQIGPDNTHPSEYVQFCSVAQNAVKKICARTPWRDQDHAELAAHIRQNSDRLVFNATAESIESFFQKTDRMPFLHILDHLQLGNTIDENCLGMVQQFYQSISYDLEFHAVNSLFLLSAANNLGATLSFWRQHFDKFTHDTSPVEVDLFQAVLVYIMVVHNIGYDDTFSRYEEKILENWKEILLYRPGLNRGLRRGYHDQFDMIFEDGFGVIYPYGLLRPALKRRSLRFRDYQEALTDYDASSPLPLYSKYLKEFLVAGKLDEAIQVLHALCQVGLSWPIEGLVTMRDVIGHVDPIIKRAMVRIIAELYNRRPYETADFLRKNGSSLSEEDLQEIKVRQDPRIGGRQIEEQQWARILHFFLRDPQALNTYVSCLRSAFSARSLDQAIGEITKEIGLYTQHQN